HRSEARQAAHTDRGTGPEDGPLRAVATPSVQDGTLISIAPGASVLEGEKAKKSPCSSCSQSGKPRRQGLFRSDEVFVLLDVLQAPILSSQPRKELLEEGLDLRQGHHPSDSASHSNSRDTANHNITDTSGVEDERGGRSQDVVEL